jgi:hypothetical protein
VLSVTAPTIGTKSTLRKRRINPFQRISELFTSCALRQNTQFPVDGSLILLMGYRGKYYEDT